MVLDFVRSTQFFFEENISFWLYPSHCNLLNSIERRIHRKRYCRLNFHFVFDYRMQFGMFIDSPYAFCLIRLAMIKPDCCSFHEHHIFAMWEHAVCSVQSNLFSKNTIQYTSCMEFRWKRLSKAHSLLTLPYTTACIAACLYFGYGGFPKWKMNVDYLRAIPKSNATSIPIQLTLLFKKSIQSLKSHFWLVFKFFYLAHTKHSEKKMALNKCVCPFLCEIEKNARLNRATIHFKIASNGCTEKY